MTQIFLNSPDRKWIPIQFCKLENFQSNKQEHNEHNQYIGALWSIIWFLETFKKNAGFILPFKSIFQKKYKKLEKYQVLNFHDPEKVKNISQIFEMRFERWRISNFW